jgi:magnesium transporter
LRELLIADGSTPLTAITNSEILFVRVDDDQESAARLMARYDLLSLPVVDEERRLVGVIQHEDLVDVLQEEATEDMYRLVGVGSEERPGSPVRSSLRRRLPWLLVYLGTQLVVVRTLMAFESTIEQVAVLAVLFPIVTGQGGNVGSESMTLVVRSLALGEIDRSNRWRMLRKEVALGLLNGVAIGLLAAGLAYVIAGDPAMAAKLATAISLAMMLNLAAGGLAGATVPLVLERFGQDPALASGMMVATVTDTMGVVFFMGLFRLML